MSHKNDYATKKDYTLALLLILGALSIPLTLQQSQTVQETRQQAQTAGNTLYVSPNGSGDCSQASPCSIAQADSKATPGTTIQVAPGNYGTVTLSKSGTATARIQWISQQKWGAKMSGNVNSTVEIRGSYVDFEGFDVTGGANAQNLIDSGPYGRVIGNYVHDSPRGCQSNGGITTTGNTEVSGNFIKNIGQGSPGGCNLFHGIYFDTGDVIKNNIIVNTPNGSGIHSWHDTTKVVVVNNTVMGAGADGILIGSETGVHSGSFIANNISINNNRDGARDSGTANGNTYVNNLYFGNKGQAESINSKSKSTGAINADPMLVNAAGGDFHLKPESPAIDTGVADMAPRTDYEGKTRPAGAGIDIGAFEFGATANTSPAISNAPSLITPTLFCLGVPCAGEGISPTGMNTVPSTNPQTNPSNPVESVTPPAPQLGGNGNPCETNTVSIQHDKGEKKKHKKSKDSNDRGGFIEQFIKMLMQLLERLFTMLGIPVPNELKGDDDSPNTNPCGEENNDDDNDDNNEDEDEDEDEDQDEDDGDDENEEDEENEDEEVEDEDKDNGDDGGEENSSSDSAQPDNN